MCECVCVCVCVVHTAIVTLSENLQMNAKYFKRGAQAVQRKLWWQNVKVRTYVCMCYLLNRRLCTYRLPEYIHTYAMYVPRITSNVCEQVTVCVCVCVCTESPPFQQ